MTLWIFVEPEVKFDETDRIKIGFADLIKIDRTKIEIADSMKIDFVKRAEIWLIELMISKMTFESIDFVNRAKFDFAAD